MAAESEDLWTSHLNIPNEAVAPDDGGHEGVPSRLLDRDQAKNPESGETPAK